MSHHFIISKFIYYLELSMLPPLNPVWNLLLVGMEKQDHMHSSFGQVWLALLIRAKQPSSTFPQIFNWHWNEEEELTVAFSKGLLQKIGAMCNSSTPLSFYRRRQKPSVPTNTSSIWELVEGIYTHTTSELLSGFVVLCIWNQSLKLYSLW